MANRIKILAFAASSIGGLEQEINKKLDLLPQYRVVNTSSACGPDHVGIAGLAVGDNRFFISATIVLELIAPCEQDSGTAPAEMTTAELLEREA
ncbi:MAG: hypothetical protein A3C02_00110 [Candidatus Andersenbacteria bacterium RIFCSPHIGHO2_02_FULL_45_11]|uniref:Uncharacterized protein n=1 Tax=Candidatus Andersenbacteria bacterium RIFCSPHIGHO2_12_FULL_45_11 TaxID=1797281 RepID=A0A1G1X3M5_9BACT|nr:MAG: hypothetical protein A2805_02075 [Candidatus Andersenbacteria bacterium RIFCSPHIGHO2_01_FULL_46_36]OGY31959.1 MAG: hypothetical protein A3C02_00110 [Candidatus Andersenbacteria bacterium RIFCSPHIGHO2_02_FULL_45_11]OGY34170.1 MAG: hypothetical protein A3D99_00430 [Candidatus Andersenbacteria bacterium RIFCSPHIGHO2_12_FULL_45_11]QBM02289.1 hypothetical protein [uncultured archaeon]